MERSDRRRWNDRYRDSAPDFTPHPLVAQAFAAGFPAGPVLELACGRSGSALALAEAGRSVVAVDVSDVALEQLRAEAKRRCLTDRVWCVQADLPEFVPAPRRCGLVLATRFWDAVVFRAACAAVAPGGLLGWEALAATGPGDSRRWRVRSGGLGAALGREWRILAESSPEPEMEKETRFTTMLARRISTVTGQVT